MSEAARLSVLVEAKGISQTKAGLMGVHGTLGSVSKRAIEATAAVTGVYTAFRGLEKAGAMTVGFDRSMRNVNSIAQLSERQFAKLEKSVLGMAGKTAQAPQTLADGLYDLVSSGFKGKGALTVLEASARAATAGLTDTATSVKAVAAVLNAYHRPASAAKQVSDDLFQTVNRGVITFGELAQNIGDVLPFANALHVNLKQVGAATSTMTKAGVSAPETMTRIKSAMSALIKPSTDLQGAYKKLGVTSGDELIRKTGSFQGALQALSKEVGGNKEKMAQLFPDIRALGGALLLTGDNARSANQDLSAFGKDKGATMTALKEQAKSIAHAWETIKAQVSADVIAIGNKAVPAVFSAIEAVSGFVTDFKHGAGAAGEFQHAVAPIAGTVSGLATTLFGVGKGVASFAGDLLRSRTALTALAGAGAGLASLKVAAAAAPGVKALAVGLGDVGLAFRAGGIAFAGETIMSMVNPLALAGVAAAGLGAAIALLATRESAEAAAAREAAAAKREQKAAMDDLAGKERSTVEARLSAQRSTIDLHQAEQNLLDLQKGGKATKTDLADAELTISEAATRSARAHRDYNMALERNAAAQNTVRKSANDRLRTAQQELTAAGKSTIVNGGRAGQQTIGPDPKRLAAAQREYNAAMQAFGDLNNAASASELQRQRIEAGQPRLTERNLAGVRALTVVMDKLPKKVQTRLLADNQDALAKAGELGAQLVALGKRRTVSKILADANSAKAVVVAFEALLAGVKPEKVVKILASTSSAKQEIAALKAQIASLQDKTVTIRTQQLNTTTNSQAPAPGQARRNNVPAPHPQAKGHGAMAHISSATPTVAGATTPDRRAGLALMQEIWGQAAQHFGRSGQSMPRVKFWDNSMPVVGTTFNSGSGKVGSRRVEWPDWVNKLFLKKDPGMLGMLIHEWAHYFQKTGLSDKNAEGGAQLFSRRVSPEVFAALGIPYKNAPFASDQYPGFMSQAKGNGEDWIMRGQFANPRAVASAARAKSPKKVKGLNPDTNKIEYHTPAEWKSINLKHRQQQKRKAAHKKAMAGAVSAFDMDIASSDVAVAQAQLTPDNADDLAALIGTASPTADLTSVTTGRAGVINKRLAAIRAKLKRKKLSRKDRQRLLQEQAQLTGELGGMGSTISGMAPASAATVAQSGVALAALTPDLNDDVSAASNLVKAFTDDLTAAKATGDPTKIAEAAQNLKSASDQLNVASESIKDNVNLGDNAALVQAQVNTPNDKTDDLAALTHTLDDAVGFYNQAVGSGDNSGIVKWGGIVLQTRDSIDQLNQTIQQNTQAQQEQIDLLKAQVQIAQQAANAANAQFGTFKDWVTSVVMTGAGASVLRRSTTPAAGMTGSL